MQQSSSAGSQLLLVPRQQHCAVIRVVTHRHHNMLWQHSLHSERGSTSASLSPSSQLARCGMRMLMLHMATQRSCSGLAGFVAKTARGARSSRGLMANSFARTAAVCRLLRAVKVSLSCSVCASFPLPYRARD